MVIFDAGEADGGLAWLPADDLPSDATPAELFEMDVSRLPLAGPQAEFVWAEEAK
ncbi:hypothetical protein [Lentzea nigeriaca]|uniref:hypothetical protein n=1 Tax=Lentzea nigeriaca TaxID=1128665 RepID=UPI001957AE58|nr:hypothetical protein [Lentzea nigeriaca]MBM7861791.1 hypothetical protein [Lentzea nigeriaca]